MLIFPNQHAENDLVFNCCTAEWYHKLSNPIAEHRGIFEYLSAQIILHQKTEFKDIFVYMSMFIAELLTGMFSTLIYIAKLPFKEIVTVLIMPFHSYLPDVVHYQTFAVWGSLTEWFGVQTLMNDCLGTEVNSATYQFCISVGKILSFSVRRFSHL